MVMKDKLVKTHHKAIYYTARKMALVIVAAMSFVCAVFIPTYIVATAHKSNAPIHAEENSLVNENNDESESLETYEEFEQSSQEGLDQ